jgi:outer membrane protein OmpA-like peptidoglycan-associated protein
MIFALLTLPLASATTWGAYVVGGGADAPAEDRAYVGLGGIASWTMSPRLMAELHTQAGVTALMGPRVDARPEARVRLTGLDSKNAVVFIGGYGVSARPELGPSGALGFGLDLPTGARGVFRLDLRMVTDGLTPATAELSLGLVRAPPAPVIAAPEPAPEASQPLVWLPHPYCEWVPADELARHWSRLPPEHQVWAVAPGGVPQLLPPGQQEVTALELTPRPEQGGLVLVGIPGDKLMVGDVSLSVGADGVAVLITPEGVVEATVVGGGRREELVAAVSGHVVYLRAGRPEPVMVRFPKSSATLSGDDIERLHELARATEGWEYELQGSASPEGAADVNTRLAEERAAATRAVLEAAGVPPEKIRVLSVDRGLASDAPAEDLRSCTVRAVPPRPAEE